MIGVDGGTLKVVEPWAKAGYLPNWARVMAEGCWGPMRSTYPGLTAPAWMSFKTGKHPGKTGIYDFFYRNPKTMRHHVVSAKDCQEPDLIDILNSQGKRVGMLFEPTSFPARPLDGFMISGFLSSQYVEGGYTYPEDLFETHHITEREKLRKVTTIGECYRENRLDEFRDAVIENIRKQAETALLLMKAETWDCFFVHFFGSDTICHGMWKFMDVENPESGKEHAGAVLRVYQEIDRQIGVLMDELGPGGLTIILSDHGFGRGKEQINVNNWLLEQGLLYLRPTTYPIAVRALETLRARRGGWRDQWQRRYAVSALITGLPLYSLLPRAGQQVVDGWLNRVLDRRPRLKSLSMEQTFYFDQIDWSRTRAYAIGARGGIFINLQGREAAGIVPPADYEPLRDWIIQHVNQIRTPSGELAIANACRREDVYGGPYLDRAPDVVTVTEELGFLVRATIGDQVIEPNPQTISGLHRSEGMLFLHGPGVRAGAELRDASIVDVLPTLLFYMELGIPDDLDGKPLVGTALPEYLQAQPPRTVSPLGPRTRGEDGTSDERDDALVETLTALGYL
jgi:predicted AlkP superfamily phosphohydrolase/phosphomutase